MKNKIAVIMSIYKNDKLEYLKEAMNSLYGQTYKKFDIFIQCDGILPIALANFLENEFEKNRIYLLNKRDENRGLAYSLNELLEEVFKKDYLYIARMDADDISLPKRIEEQVDFLGVHSDIDIVGGWIEEFNMDTHTKQIIRYPKKHDNILKEMGKRCAMAHVTTVFRKTFFENTGFYNPDRLTEDYDLWIRGFENNCKFANLQTVLVKVRTNNAFYSRRKNLKRAYDVMSIKIKAIRKFSLSRVGYLYAIAHFLLYMSPTFIKHFIYKYFR